MSYNTSKNYSGQRNRPDVKPMSQTGGGVDTAKAETLFRTGLFLSDGGKSLASVQVKEAITIPAGSYINLFHNTDKKTDASPDYTISVRSGVLKQRA